MKNQQPLLSLSVCKRLLPVVGAGKYIAIFCAILFQQDSTLVPLVICASAAIFLICLDSILKISFWKCPRCKKQLPHDFYSRKTMTKCPFCKEVLDFSGSDHVISSKGGDTHGHVD